MPTPPLTADFRAALLAATDRLDRLGLAGAPLLLLQNAPPPMPPDAEALAEGTDSRRRAERLWHLRPDQLEAMVRVNVLQYPPERYRDPAGAGTARVSGALSLLGTRVSAVMAAGTVAAEAAARALRLPRVPTWNDVIRSPCGRAVLAVPHPSGLCRLYNPGQQVGAAAPAAVRRLLAA